MVEEGKIGQIRAGPVRAGHGRGRAKPQAEEDLVGPGRPHIGLRAGSRELGQAQGDAKDKSAIGISGPAMHCHRPFTLLSVLAQHCPALTEPSWPCPVLPGPSRPCRFCLAPPCYTLPGAVPPGPARHCPAMPGLARIYAPGLALLCHGQPSLVYPAGHYPILSGPALPLSDSAGHHHHHHHVYCTKKYNSHARSCQALPSPLRHWTTLHGLVLPSTAMFGAARHDPALHIPVGTAWTLSGPPRPV